MVFSIVQIVCIVILKERYIDCRLWYYLIGCCVICVCEIRRGFGGSMFWVCVLWLLCGCSFD